MSTCTCRVRRAEAPEEGATEGGEGRGVAGTCDQSAVATPGWRSGAAIISTTSALSICFSRASTESRSWPGTWMVKRSEIVNLGGLSGGKGHGLSVPSETPGLSSRVGRPAPSLQMQTD